MGSTVPAQMFDHELNPLKGWPSPYALDKSAKIVSAVEAAKINRGLCCSLDSNGKFVRGCPNGAMPIFAFPGGMDFDVDSDYGNISGGVLSGLVATGGYELQTTEFKGTGFVPNAVLTADDGSGDDADKGKLKTTTLGSSDMIVGVVSGVGTPKNEHGKQFLTFWPVYLPSR